MITASSRSRQEPELQVEKHCSSAQRIWEESDIGGEPATSTPAA
ncbi:hypothetical protein MKZ23_11105 [Paenibacillus sp. FSL R5-0876]